MLTDGDLDTLRGRFAGPRELVVELAAPAPDLDGLPGVLTALAEAGGLRRRFTFDPTTSAAELIAAVTQRVEIRDVTIREPSIEDLVRALYSAS